MFNKKYLTVTLSLLLALIVVRCSSQEYTSAKLYIQQLEWEKAEEFLIKALAVEPDNPEISYQLGYHIYGLQKKDWKMMNESFDKALSIDPNKKILGQPKTVKEFVVMARAQFWAEVYNKGVAQFNNYRNSNTENKDAELQKSINTFITSSEIKPDEAQSYLMLSTCLFIAGDQEGSEDYIIKAVKLSPDDANINLTAGQIFMQKQEFEEALPYIKKAVELDPSNTKSIRNLAQIYYDTGNMEKSIETYEDAINKETDRKVKADLYFNLGILYNRVDNFEEAEFNFMNALDENPDDVEAIMGMAQVFENAEKWRKAEKFYRELISIDPDNPEHYRGMSRIKLQQGEPDQSKRFLDKAKALGG
jgi:tetratricopeptide (TPR) repeat protein